MTTTETQREAYQRGYDAGAKEAVDKYFKSWYSSGAKNAMAFTLTEFLKGIIPILNTAPYETLFLNSYEHLLKKFEETDSHV